MKLHHVGFVATKLEWALECLNLGKFAIEDDYVDVEQNNFLYFCRNVQTDTWIEIVVPRDANSTVWNFACVNGFGTHHTAFLVDSIEKEHERIMALKGAVPLSRYELRIDCFGGWIKTFFTSVKGSLFEYVELDSLRHD